MSVYDIVLKKRNAVNTGWDSLLPFTIGANVLLNDESNVEDALSAKAQFKSGSGTFTSGSITYTVTDAFITAATMVIISPTSTKIGAWSVVSSAGGFTITSDATETNAVTFDWGATK